VWQVKEVEVIKHSIEAKEYQKVWEGGGRLGKFSKKEEFSNKVKQDEW
jgi:hypothetical protein